MSQHDHGLQHDLNRLLEDTKRRQFLRWASLAGLGTLGLVACSGGGETSSVDTVSGSGNSGGTGGTGSSSCAVIPEETAGPYPGDGSNSNGSGIANALALSGIVRSDIRASIAGATGVAQGVPLTVKLKLVNSARNCANLAGYAIYLWHCTREGTYSMYSAGVSNENFLRGVQETDASGEASFITIFPGCYDGRMPHIHFEVYPSLAKATTASNKVKTSQLAFPTASVNEAYTATGYAASVSNLARISFATDNVFSDGYTQQLCTVTGNVNQGYVATLTVPISV